MKTYIPNKNVLKLKCTIYLKIYNPIYLIFSVYMTELW